MQNSSQLKVGVFVDHSNIIWNGGQRMRYDVLRQYAEMKGHVIRLATYLSHDPERAKTDRDYADRTQNFQDALRDMGWQVVTKQIKWYQDPEVPGKRIAKANSDLDQAVDMITQSKNLDLILLVTGDGDFVRLVQHLRNSGLRIEVIAFQNVSLDLRREADSFTCGYLIPELIPTNRRPSSEDPEAPVWGEPGSTVRGWCYWHNTNYGFLNFLTRIDESAWMTDPRTPGSPYKSCFFHDSNLPAEVNPELLPSRRYILEYTLQAQEGDRLSATDIRLVSKL